MIDLGPNFVGRMAPAGPTTVGVTDAAVGGGTPTDLFTLGRAAAARTRELNGGRGVFARSRQLLSSGAWRGPRDAADAHVEEEDLAALGGLEAVVAAGVRTLVVTQPAPLRDPAATGLRGLVRMRFQAGESEAERLARLGELAALVRGGLSVDGVLPTTEGEPLGLDTLRFVALCRMHLPVPHVVVDFARLGHRLAQMCLGFGADELFGPIVSERALRLGDNANNPAMTRKEAATLLRGAGLVAHERATGGALSLYEFTVAPLLAPPAGGT
jgi:hypothetical protein